MEYASPQVVDLNEVYALNQTFLSMLCQEKDESGLLAALPTGLARRFSAMSLPERRRMAAAPFLLFSLREDDDGYWDDVYAVPPDRDLFEPPFGHSQCRSQLVAAALGYLWQMARQNPYTLRVVCCAPLHWCERLAEEPLMRVISCSSRRDDMLRLRAADSAAIWQKMLDAGLNRRKEIRLAAQHAVLQSLHIRPQAVGQRLVRSAACRTRIPSMGVAESE